MTILSFPSNPTVGDLYTAGNGQVYSWTGNRWQSVTGQASPAYDQSLNTTDSVQFAAVTVPNLDFGQPSIGAPANGGTMDRLTLFNFYDNSRLNYAMGVEPNYIWFTTDLNSAQGGYKFYGGGQEMLRFTGDGVIHLIEGGDIVDSTGNSVLGGGTVSTGNITFNGNTLSTTAGNDLTITSSNGNVYLGADNNLIFDMNAFSGRGIILQDSSEDGYDDPSTPSTLYVGRIYHETGTMVIQSDGRIEQASDPGNLVPNYGGLSVTNFDNTAGVFIPAGLGDPSRLGGPLEIHNQSSTWEFTTDGNIRFPNNTLQTTAFSNWLVEPITKSILPEVDNLQDIGSPTNRVRHIYVGPGSISVGNSVITESDTGKLVLPGLTRATSSYVDEVEDRADQSMSFSAEPVVIDNALYNAIVSGSDESHFADFTVTLNDSGYIDEIQVNGSGTYNTAEDAEAKNFDMHAYIGSGSASDRPLVPQDWIAIPFRPRMKANDVEYEFNTGGGDGSNLITYQDEESGYESRIELTYDFIADVDKSHLRANGNGFWDFGSDTFRTKIYSTDRIDPDPQDLVIQAGGTEWYFDRNGYLTLPSVDFQASPAIQSSGIVFGDGTTQTTAYTGQTPGAVLGLEIDGGTAFTQDLELDIDGGGA